MTTGGGFAQPTGLALASSSADGGGDLDEEGVAVATTGMGMGTSTGTSSVSVTTTAAATGTVVQGGKSAGSVVEVDLKSVIALGVLGLVAAAFLL